MMCASSNALTCNCIASIFCLTLYAHAQYCGTNVLLAEDTHLSILDANGEPVPGAFVRGGVQYGGGVNEYIPFEGASNSNGHFIIDVRCDNAILIGCRISKMGYYPTEFTFSYDEWHKMMTSVKNEDAQQYRTHEVVLKRIVNPAKLCVFPESLHYSKIPIFGKWIGLDLQEGEWTPPFGKGQYSDVLVRFSSVEHGIHNFRFEMEVSFTNSLFAGAYIMKKDRMSKFQTAYNADSNATYTTSFVFSSGQTPGKPKQRAILDTDSYLVFRTRTKLNKDGSLLSAHYGVIYGRWLSESVTMILSDGCFNPVPNDVNIEDGRLLRTMLENLHY